MSLAFFTEHVLLLTSNKKAVNCFIFAPSKQEGDGYCCQNANAVFPSNSEKNFL